MFGGPGGGPRPGGNSSSGGGAMQAQIRGEDGFPLRDDFVAMHAEGQLRSPEEAARLLLDLVTADDYGDEPLTRI